MNRIIDRGYIELYYRIHGISGGHHNNLSSTTIYNLHPNCKLIGELTTRFLGKLVTCLGNLIQPRTYLCLKKITWYE